MSSNPFETTYNYNHNPRPASRVVLATYGSGAPAHIAQRHSYQNQYIPSTSSSSSSSSQQGSYAPPAGPPPTWAETSYSGAQIRGICCCCAGQVRWIRGWDEYECGTCHVRGPVPLTGSAADSAAITTSRLRKPPPGVRRSNTNGPYFPPPTSPPPPLPPRPLDTTAHSSRSKDRASAPQKRPMVSAQDVDSLVKLFSAHSSSTNSAQPPVELLASLFLDDDDEDADASPAPSPTMSSIRNPFRRNSGNLDKVTPPGSPTTATASDNPFDPPPSPSSSSSRNPFRRSSFARATGSSAAALPTSKTTRTTESRLRSLEKAGISISDDEYTPDALLSRAILRAFSSLDSLGRSFRFLPTPSTTSTEQSFKGKAVEESESRDLMATLSAFYGLVKRQRAHLDVLRDCVEALLEKPGQDLLDNPSGDWVAAVLENPILRSEYTPDHARRMRMLGRTLGLLAHLPNAAHHQLVTQHLALPATRSTAGSTTLAPDEVYPYPAHELERKVDLVVSYISHRIGQARAVGGSAMPISGYEEDWGVRAGAKVGALLFAANAAQPRLPISSFYCTLVDSLGEASAVESFVRWEQREEGRFTLCQYPFLISLGIKIHLLNFDGQRQMMDQARQALHTTLARRHLELPLLQLKIRRSNLVHDSMEQISANRMNLKKKLLVTFMGEEGVDAGGLRKEWFLLLCRQLFDPQWGMFKHDDDSNLCWFNASSEDLDEFWLVGAVVGLACYNAATLDIPLPTAVYKKLMNEPVALRDLANINPSLARGLQQLLDYDGDDVEDTFCRSFVGEIEEWGEVREVELLPGGASKMVTNDNREEFVQLYVAFLLTASVSSQFEAFSAGFSQVTSGNSLSLFKGEELELLVRGSSEPLDIDSLQAITQYQGWPEGEHHHTVRLFWHVFKTFPPESQRLLLSFITGSDRIPATGTTALTLKLTNAGYDTSRYPTSHTCFNELCLPAYGPREEDLMRRKLEEAMRESEGFGLK